MTLTKRLYRIDEVRAAFLFTLRLRRVEESQFWLHELEESFYGGEAQRLLFVAWFLFVGLKNLSWLLLWCRDSSTVEGRRRLCLHFCRMTERDGSLWWILVTTPQIDTDSRILEVWRHKCVLDGEEFWQSVVDASTDERIDEILEGLQADMKGYTLLAKLAAVAITTLRTDKSSWPTIPERDPTPFCQFQHQDNIRLARKYEIPFFSLYGMTWRGRGADTSDDLKTLGLAQFKQSPYWRKTAGELVTDDEIEAFWDTHFNWVTCDHPDEWSAADRHKSHGEGVDCQRGAPLWRWWKNWIPAEHNWFWGYPKRVCWKWVDAQRADVGDTVLSRILELYKGLEEKALPPRKKKVFVLEETV